LITGYLLQTKTVYINVCTDFDFLCTYVKVTKHAEENNIVYDFYPLRVQHRFRQAEKVFSAKQHLDLTSSLLT